VWFALLQILRPVRAVAFVIPERRKKCRLAQQVLLDIEEHGPEGWVRAVGHRIAAEYDEVGHAVLQQLLDHGAMHVMPGPRIAIQHEMKGLAGRGRRLEGT